MLRQILKQLDTKTRKQLYMNQLVCGCMYRSFTDIQANIFFRLTCNDGRLSRQQLLQIIARNTDNQKQQVTNSRNYQHPNYTKMKKILINFAELDIVLNSVQQVKMDSFSVTLNRTFAKNLQSYLLTNRVVEPIRGFDAPLPTQPQPYQFLQLMLNDKLPKNCKIQGLNSQASFPTKDQFKFIKSDISWKIGLLINGIICSSNRLKNIQYIVYLNLLDSNQYYQKTSQLQPILYELKKINLVQFAGPNDQYFRISKYLQHFTFSKAPNQKEVKTKLNCKIIIETNFKVFVILQPNNTHENRVIRQILRLLIQCSNDGIEYEQLLIGCIDKKFMRAFFKETEITPQQYFQFFKQYMDEGEKKKQDLGKWNKIKFLGMQGPSQDGMIPSNIRQEVTLWDKFRQNSPDQK